MKFFSLGTQVLLTLLSLTGRDAYGVTLKISGSTTVNPVITTASEVFRAKGWKMLIDTQGGSSGGISQLAEGMIDIAMSSRPIQNHDRNKWPKITFTENTIGFDGVAMVVSDDVFKGGVTRLTRDQLKNIYEGKVTNWQQVGGPDQKIVFFNKEPGRGTWEVFAIYLYGKAENAPKVFHQEVGSNQEAREKVASYKGAITQLSAAWIDNKLPLKGVALESDNGKAIEPTLARIADGSYPMRRPLVLVTNGPATGEKLEIINYMKSPAGQKIVADAGYISLSSH
jgi:phosphate transport system substrate-binding protein